MNKRKDDENLRNRFTAWVEHVVRNAKHYYLRKEVKRIRTVSLDEMDSEILYYEINNEKIEDFFFGDEKIYNAYIYIGDYMAILQYTTKERKCQEVIQNLKKYTKCSCNLHQNRI